MRRNPKRWRAIEARLGRETEIWIATVRHDGRPHLVPVWFVYLEGKLYFCTGTETQKWVNLLHNQSVSISLPDVHKVIVLEGEAHAVGRQTTADMADYFLHKYDWDFRTDTTSSWRVVEVTIQKVLAWGDGFDESDGIRAL